MHSGWPFSLHTPFPDRWGFEPKLLPERKSGVFTDVYKFAQSTKSGAIFAAGGYFFMSFFIRA